MKDNSFGPFRTNLGLSPLFLRVLVTNKSEIACNTIKNATFELPAGLSMFVFECFNLFRTSVDNLPVTYQ